MDIEKINLCAIGTNVHSEQQDVIRELERTEINVRRVHSLVNKVKNKHHLYQYLLEQYAKTASFILKINILQMLSQYFVDPTDPRGQTDQNTKTTIAKIYELRHTVDSNHIQIDQILQVLNKLLKLTLSLLKTQIKTTNCPAQKIAPTNTIQLLLEEQQKNVFTHLANRLFTIHLLTKIAELDHLPENVFQYIKHSIIQSQTIFQSLPPINNPVLQNYAVLTYAKVIPHSTPNQYHLQLFLNNLTFQAKLLLITQAHVNCYWELIKDQKCQNEQQFEQLSVITQKYFIASNEPSKEEICNCWLNNCFHILHCSSQIDIEQHLSDFPQDLLIQIYFKVSDLFNSAMVSSNQKQYLLQMWKLTVLDNRISVLLQEYKNMFINCELILFQLTREVTGLLPCSLPADQIPVVLQIYSFYYNVFLKHQECSELRHRLITMIIRQFPSLLREDMLLKDSLAQEEEGWNLPQSQYQTDYLRELALQCGNKFRNSGSALKLLSKEVATVFIKYLIEGNVLPVKQLLTSDDIAEYIISNNIQIRMEGVDDILEQNIKRDTQKYIKLLGETQDKSIYQDLINKHSINFLMNETNAHNLSKVFQLTPFLIKHLTEQAPQLCKIAIQCGVSPHHFITSLYSLFIRSLYYNLSNLLYLMLLAINELKMQYCIDFVQIEVKAVEELVKFCKMYTNNNQYLLVGYTSLLFLLYGSPFQSREFFGYHFQIGETFSQNNYFIAKFTDLLSQQKLYSDRQPHPVEENSQHDTDLLVVIRKNLTFGLVCHIRYLIDSKILKHISEINLLRKAFNNYVMTEANTHNLTTEGFQIPSPTQITRKRNFSFQNDQEGDLFPGKKEKKKKVKPQIKREAGFITALMDKYKEHDQIRHYSALEQQLANHSQLQHRNPLNLERVHGKIRNILHIRK